MNSIPTFSADVALYSDEDTGLRVECSEKIASIISSSLSSAGFTCSAPTVEVTGTKNINNWVAMPFAGGDWLQAQTALKECLTAANVRFAEELSMGPGEKHIRYNLLDLSVFDKQA